MQTSSLVLFGTAALFTGGFWLLYRKGRKKPRNLKNFVVERTLKIGDNDLTLLGYFKDDPERLPGLLLIQKTQFAASDTHLISKIHLHKVMDNDVYSTYLADVPRSYKPFKITLIYPATKSHIQKSSEQKYHVVVETKETYDLVTLPFIQNIPPTKLQWVYNILDYKSEVERIIYDHKDPTNGFILLPNFNWNDFSNLDCLYCLAIVKDQTIRSLRDLKQKHLSLLINIRDIGLSEIESKFAVSRDQIRVFVHYLPSYYLFHVHFTHVNILNGISIGKAVMLEDIIYNLSKDDLHFENATLTYVIGEVQHQELYEAFVKVNVLPG